MTVGGSLQLGEIFVFCHSARISILQTGEVCFGSHGMERNDIQPSSVQYPHYTYYLTANASAFLNHGQQ